MGQKNTEKLPLLLILLLYFASGALALIYELVWSRMMMQVFGSTALAVGTVLAAFMAGMAMGSWLIGKHADRSLNCLRLYAYLEFGIALTALLSHILLSRIGPVHIALFEFFGFSDVSFAFIRFLLAFLLVMVPTLLMGATMPVLARFLVTRRTLVGINLSTLYATNTFGAVSGVLLTGFFLIGRYGIHVPVYIAVLGNVLIGCAAWILSRRLPASTDTVILPMAEPQNKQTLVSAVPGPGTVRIILIGLGISGFTSFAYEIYWTRSLVFILGNSTYALTTMLSAFLSGIGLGGYLVRFLLRRIRDRAAAFGWIQVLLGVFSALALPLLFFITDPQSMYQYLVRNSDQVFPLVFSSFGVVFLVMLVPAVLIGATFPLAGDIVVKSLRNTGSTVGKTYAVNTLGNVLGALLPGVILIGWMGIQKGILMMAVLNIGLGFLILFVRLTGSGRAPAWRVALPALMLLAVFIMSRAPLQFQFPSDGEQPFHRTLFYREGPLATTKVYWTPGTTEKHMSVDGIVIGGTGFAEYKQLLLAHLPKLLVDDVSTELSVGLGSGMLVGESALHPRVREITSVEIEPSVIEGAQWFAQENHQALQNSRIRIVSDDIGNFLRTHSDTYQVITADEKTADAYASNGFSYSLEYYTLLRNHLAPGGLAAQWVPATLPPRQFKMVLKTITQSFPHVQLWYFLPAHKKGPFNTILIGSNERIVLDYEQINRRLAENPVAFQSMVPFGLTSAEALLPHFVADETVISETVRNIPINSLEYPRYEFFYPWDYSIDRDLKVIENHNFIRELKQAAHAGFMANLVVGEADKNRLEQTLEAEDAYLLGFQQFLSGISLNDMYYIFDRVLSRAPWNDSLRARIFAQYSHVASTRSNPAERSRLMRKANTLYENKPNTLHFDTNK